MTSTKRAKKQTFLLSPKLRWRDFKKIYDSFPTGGIVPMHMDKILWQMVRDNRIYVGFSNGEDDLFIATKLPKGKLTVISSKPNKRVPSKRV